MNRGRYEQLGDPEQLYERPTTRFVAGFLGVSNLLPGVVEDTADGFATLALDGGALVRAPRAIVDVPTGSTIDIGVRPEKIRLREKTDAVPAGHNQLSGIVRDVSYLGVSTQYQVEASGGGVLTVYEQNVERATRAELWRAGESVVMTWAPEHSFVVRGEQPSGDGSDSGASEVVASGGPIEPVREPAATA
jgi:spermidine/putrescine transport system ATP-binding protein